MTEREEKKGGPLTTTVTWQYETYLKTEREVTCMLQIKVADNVPPSGSATVRHDVCLVIDISGSMEADNKLRMVKKTAEFIIRNLPASDAISVVTFSDEAKEVIPLTVLNTPETRTKLTGLVNGLETEGRTNLCAGILTGIRSLRESQNLKIVIVLTDGATNMGVTDEAEIQKMVKEVQPVDCKLNTIGVGEAQDMNRKLLEKLAVETGTFFFVQNSDHIATCFGDCIGAMMSLVATKIRVGITGAPMMVSCGSAPVVNLANRLEWEFSDLMAGESRNIIIGTKGVVPGETAFTTTLEYVNVATGAKHQDQHVTPRIPCGEEAKTSENVEVQVHLMRIMVGKAMEKRDARRLKMYRDSILNGSPALQTHPIIIQLLQDLAGVEQQPESSTSRAFNMLRQRTGFVEEEELSSAVPSPYTSVNRTELRRQYSQQVSQAPQSPPPP